MAEVVALPGMAYSRSGNAPAKTKRKAPARRRPDRGPRAAAAPAPLSLRAAKRDVFDLGATGLDKRQRKIRDDARLAALGCKAPRNPKMPFKMVLGIRRAEDARERKRLAERRESGVVAPKDSLLKCSVETKRFIRPLEQSEKTGAGWGTSRSLKASGRSNDWGGPS